MALHAALAPYDTCTVIETPSGSSSLCRYGWVVRAVDVPFRTRVGDDARRHATHRGVGRDVFDHDRVRSDRRMISNMNASDDLGAGSDVYVIADGGAAGLRAAVHLPERDALREVAVVADDHRRVHHDAAEMPDVQAAADARIAGNVDSEADRVAVQQQHRHLAHAKLTPTGGAGVSIEAQHSRIAESRCGQEPAPEHAGAEPSRVPPQI